MKRDCTGLSFPAAISNNIWRINVRFPVKISIFAVRFFVFPGEDGEAGRDVTKGKEDYESLFG
jgi:hypothetical protein